MQNDILFETMTPRGTKSLYIQRLKTFIEILTFTANLRLNASSEEKRKKVNQLLIDLKLERAADTLVGGPMAKGISGGERKRASIGVELITDPNLIFLDEPTSGLDSFTAFILISLLKNLAVRGGKTIVFTIHQPSSDTFFLFDNLMVLAKGKFIYQGPTRAAVDYFGAIEYQCPEYTNPADYFIEVAHSDAHDDQKFHGLYESYDQKLAPKIQEEVGKEKLILCGVIFEAYVSNKELVLAEKINGFFTSARLIARRSFLNNVRNPVLLVGQFTQTRILHSRSFF
jgi:ABC-type multidrug transport system ATPase subunit